MKLLNVIFMFLGGILCSSNYILVRYEAIYKYTFFWVVCEDIYILEMKLHSYSYRVVCLN